MAAIQHRYLQQVGYLPLYPCRHLIGKSHLLNPQPKSDALKKNGGITQ